MASQADAAPSGSPDVTCVECEDQQAELECTDCQEPFCRPCWDQQHRRGKRAEHSTVLLLGDIIPEGMGTAIPQPEASAEQPEAPLDTSTDDLGAKPSAMPGAGDAEVAELLALFGPQVVPENSRYIPLRLSDAERETLYVLNGALQVSEYTDNVDIRSWNKDALIVEELEHMLEYVLGLGACSDFKATKKRVALGLGAKPNIEFFQQVFEIGRRFKVMNPEKMRSTFGKLLHMLQDSIQCRSVKLRLKIPIQTVHALLAEYEALGLLDEAQLPIATADTSLVRPEDMERALAAKAAARQYLMATYAKDGLDVERVLLSMTDSNNYQAVTLKPIQKMIEYLQFYFEPKSSNKSTDLTISYGKGGSKLSHPHGTQYTFVLQTLMLWKEVTKRMFSLWHAADEDMLSGSRYILANTGQGLNRMQDCPNVSAAMREILRSVQRQCGSWVGLSVVHLGDRDVPNALVFIDKYTQIPRILNPIVQTIEAIDDLAQDPCTAQYVCGGIEQLKTFILRDFFRHGFDGSGSDGGSCIDGRLTSAWNWCSKLEKKEYYHVFMLAGFEGFDGSFKA
eukprot:m.60090 g.60090  ORF g.60090 m.60090 type:complete len:566 (-) comp11799_c1_seq1:124-1821(-)